ncbi:uncharacterized protein BT62DRAFT_1006907 [Guyanagaster necrorhizus]|uniref:Uncharacterized protein n=1 Tax=Guyanagaster necrorhizus TaxID=856835 RepID=A0A9P7VRA5_9AGAR|nr:uncharacterized protein BT62DRAFT_1006907 [Guyanagaster necrorhizus MCA 3950]KAG7445223.1 hypothetical protein BT62DRAFT_1006907 [Guyanagaster necrorhizus MCA 3950]
MARSTERFRVEIRSDKESRQVTRHTNTQMLLLLFLDLASEILSTGIPTPSNVHVDSALPICVNKISCLCARIPWRLLSVLPSKCHFNFQLRHKHPRIWTSTCYVKFRIFAGLIILYDQPRYKGRRYGSRAVRIGARSLLKQTSIVEIKAMASVSRLTSLLVPRLHHICVDHNVQPDGRQICWVIMEYMPGRTYDNAWPSLISKQRNRIQEQMHNYQTRLFSGEFYLSDVLFLLDGYPDGYVSLVGTHPCWDYELGASQAYGPFPSL